MPARWVRNRSLIFACCTFATCLAWASSVFAQEAEVAKPMPAATVAEDLAPGDLLRVIRAGAELHLRDKTVVNVARGTRVEVSKVRPGWIGGYASVGAARVPGWILRTDLGPAPDDAAIEKAITQLTNLGLTVEKNAEGRPLSVKGEDARISDEDLELFASLDDLDEIDLSGSAIKGTGLKYLAGLPGLQTLHLVNTEVDDAALAAIGQMTGLTGLSLSETKITDKGLERLKNLKQLKVLNLASTAITDQGLVHLAGLKGIETLTLSETKITGTGFDQLQDFQDLITLNLDGCPLAEGTLKNFSGLKKIRILRMYNTTAPKEDIDALEEAVTGLAIFHE